MTRVADLATEVSNISLRMEALIDEVSTHNVNYAARELRKLQDELDDLSWRLDERPCPRCTLPGYAIHVRRPGTGVDLTRVARPVAQILQLHADAGGPKTLSMSPQEFDAWLRSLPPCPDCTTHTGDVGYIYPNIA